MNRAGPHRKRLRHFNDAGHCHELTFSCYRRLPLLTNDTWRSLLSQSIDRAADRHDYRLFAFVYMPEHVHLLVYRCGDSSGIDELLRAIKRPFSHRVKQMLTANRSRLLDQLTIRQRPGVSTFRFWQEGGGYDRNLAEPRSVLAAIDYLHENPVRRGLCRRAMDWLWSSARFYENDAAHADRDPRLPTIHRLPAEFLQ